MQHKKEEFAELFYPYGLHPLSLNQNYPSFQIESGLKEQIQAFLFALSANVEKDSLLIIIFEVSVGPVIHKELHKLIGLFVVYQNGREI